MSAIHLIEKQNLFKQVSRSPAQYESGFWAVSVQEADALVGGNIYFHEKQAAASFYGGIIQGYRVADEEQYQGRIIFRFEPKPECRGALSGGNWNFEKKIVL